MASSDKSAKNSHPFDVTTVERLIGLMTQHDLSEVDLHSGESRIRLRRGHAPAAMAMPMPTPAHAPTPASTPAAPAVDHKKYHVITSPTPGTFYAQATPSDPAYVKPGSKVNGDTVVCKIEAMKIFNDITADCSGTIIEILVKNAEPVEYGQPLFKVET